MYERGYIWVKGLVRGLFWNKLGGVRRHYIGVGRHVWIGVILRG